MWREAGMWDSSLYKEQEAASNHCDACGVWRAVAVIGHVCGASGDPRGICTSFLAGVSALFGMRSKSWGKAQV